ncbi:ATP-binding protein [Halobaculum sp. MBLA0143]|uniref:sensor histidine kinase n=1 Tax=Halobaculum sp. MBLA0143 TaxID=3079933 RepID=UPI003526330E
MAGGDDRPGGERAVGAVRVVVRLLPARVRESYSAKLLVALLLIVVVVAVSGVLVQAQLSSVLEADVDERLLTQTESEADELSEFVAAGRSQAVLVSDTAGLSGDPARLSRLLSDKLSKLPASTANLHLVSVRDGTVVATTDDRLARGEPLGPAVRLGTVAFDGFTDSYVTDPFQNPRGTRVIGFVSPVSASPETLLILTVRADSVDETFQAVTQDGFTRVVAANGRVVVAGDAAATGRPYQMATNATAPVVARGRDGESGIVDDGARERTLEGDYVQAYAPVSGTDWVLVKHAPTAQAYRLERTVTRGIGLLVVLTLVGVVVIGGVAGRDTVSAVRTLSRRAEAIEAGDYDVRLDNDRDDEIGELFTAVRRMRDRLVEQIRVAEDAGATAQAARAELERRNEAVENQKAMISVLNRFLRHNLRNRLNVVIGHLELLEAGVAPDERSRRRQQIRDTLRGLLTKADKARYVESLATDDTARERIDAGELLQTEVDHLESTFEDATVHRSVDEDLFVRGHDTLAVVFENLLENAVVHNDRETPTVEVRATADGDAVRVRIADDGPGIPDAEVETLSAGYETAVSHASGIGLWVTNWVVSELDGQLRFDDRDPRGTVAVVRLPRVDGGETDSGDGDSGNEGDDSDRATPEGGVGTL